MDAMGLVTRDALAGYLLEEVLAHLLRSNGYRLLTSAGEDVDALTEAGHGLLVRGRGANHQADALGDLLVPSPFSLPVRLFVEGKNRKAKVSLADVRNAHGVITDVNEHYSSDVAMSWREPLRRYQYRYALFSSAGFKSEAQSYALAHQISLVDLSGAAFEPLVSAVRKAAGRGLRLANDHGLAAFPVNQVRHALRAALAGVDAASGSEGAYRAGPGPAVEAERTARDIGGLPPELVSRWAAKTTDEINSSSSGEELLIGFPQAPFILAMRPDSMDDFESFVTNHGPDIRVQIGFGVSEGVGGDWYLTPADDPTGFRLRFGLPGLLEAWLLSVPEKASRRAAEAKQSLLSSISVFVDDRLVRLVFQPVPAPAGLDDLVGHDAESGLPRLEVPPAAADATESSWLRREFQVKAEPLEKPRPTRFEDSSKPKKSDRASGWTANAVVELLHRLTSGGYVQADLLLAAARQNGVLSRDAVYDVAGYPPSRSLRGVTRPFRRITAAMIGEGWLAEGVAYPFQTEFASGVRATHFLVPEEVLSALREARAANRLY